MPYLDSVLNRRFIQGYLRATFPSAAATRDCTEAATRIARAAGA